MLLFKIFKFEIKILKCNVLSISYIYNNYNYTQIILFYSEFNQKVKYIFFKFLTNHN